MKKVNWSDHAINLVVVILGVSIAFWLSEQAALERERKSERAILNEIKNNLINDTLMIDKNIAVIERIISSNDRLLNYFDEIPSDSLSYYLFNAAKRIRFYKTTTGYQRLLQRGDLSSLHDQRMVSDIINLYNNSYKRVDEWLEEEKQYTERVEEFYLNNVPAHLITGDGEMSSEDYGELTFALKSFAFKNLLIANQLAKRQLLQSIVNIKAEFTFIINDMTAL